MGPKSVGPPSPFPYKRWLFRVYALGWTRYLIFKALEFNWYLILQVLERTSEKNVTQNGQKLKNRNLSGQHIFKTHLSSLDRTKTRKMGPTKSQNPRNPLWKVEPRVCRLMEKIAVLFCSCRHSNVFNTITLTSIFDAITVTANLVICREKSWKIDVNRLSSNILVLAVAP